MAAPALSARLGLCRRPCEWVTCRAAGRMHPRSRRVARVLASGSGPAAGGVAAAAAWDRTTNRLVSASSIPFSILVLPQVAQNIGYMTSGNTAALAVISWEGYLSSLMGNTLMCSHFANSGERHAVVVQLIGIANNLAVLLQMAWAACMPRAAFAVGAAAVALGVGLSLGRLASNTALSNSSSNSNPRDPGLGTWRLWQLVSGVGGMAVVAQVLYNTLAPSAPSYLPGLAVLTLLTLWYAIPANRKDRPGALTIPTLPGWASTALFAVAPLPQLVRNFLDACSLEGLSVGTMLLALLGNSLMVPRALLIRDPVWLLGTCWACCAGWGQLLSMFLRHSPTTGLRYVDPTVFGAVTAALLLYGSYILANDGRARAAAAPKPT